MVGTPTGGKRVTSSRRIFIRLESAESCGFPRADALPLPEYRRRELCFSSEKTLTLTLSREYTGEGTRKANAVKYILK